MKRIWLCSVGLFAVLGCTPEKRSPDAIREETAHATQEAARDAKAVAQGVVEGLRQKGPININKAAQDDLETLPGVDADLAGKIIAGRPYKNSAELLHRHIVSKSEYDKIADKVKAQ